MKTLQISENDLNEVIEKLRFYHGIYSGLDKTPALIDRLKELKSSNDDLEDAYEIIDKLVKRINRMTNHKIFERTPENVTPLNIILLKKDGKWVKFGV